VVHTKIYSDRDYGLKEWELNGRRFSKGEPERKLKYPTKYGMTLCGVVGTRGRAKGHILVWNSTILQP